MKRRFLHIFILLASIGVVFFSLTCGEALYRTAFIISHVVPKTPRWFELGRYEIEVKQVEFVHQRKDLQYRDKGSSRQIADIYLPKGVRQAAFVILFPGFTPEGAHDRRLVNLARSFAGAGIGVAVPDSYTIREKTFSRDDIDRIKDTFYFLREREYVDPERIGLCGFSVAGSYVLRAASELGSRPIFVVSLGGYFDLGELFMEVISRKAVYKGKERSWEPNSLPKEIVHKVLSEQMGEESAEELLSKGDLTFYEVQKKFRLLSQEFLYTLNYLSPSPVISRIRTRVFLMHDKNDGLIPVEESRKIRDALPKDIPVYHSEFSILHHVTPTSFLNIEIVKFTWQVLMIVRLLIQ
jgi:hypothetical protein